MAASARWLALLSVAFATGCGGSGDEGETAAPVVVELTELGESGLTGTATLTPNGDRTTISIEINGGTASAKSARISTGSSCVFGGQPLADLNDVVAGRSETTVDMPLSSLADGQHTVGVQAEKTATPDDPATCGVIPAAESDTD
jgi:hypothetical protein